MSDYRDFCEMYGGSPNDPDFMEEWLREHTSDEPEIYEPSLSWNTIPAGTVVHIVKLEASYPAIAVGVVWNKKLDEELSCSGANHLNTPEKRHPASWFIRNGFTVRSSKIYGHWYQVAYKTDEQASYLSRSKTMEYQKLCDDLQPRLVRNLHGITKQ